MEGELEAPKYLSYTKELAWIEVWYIIKYFVFQKYVSSKRRSFS